MRKNKIVTFIDSLQKSDIVMAFMVTVTLSFHDKTNLMLFAQIAAFFIEVIMMNVMSGKRHIMQISGLKQYVTWEIAFIAFCALSALWASNTKTIQSSIISICQVTMTGITVLFYCYRRGADRFGTFIMLACTVLIIRMLVVVPTSSWGDGSRIGTHLGGTKGGGYGNTGITYVLSLGSVLPLVKGAKTRDKRYYLLFLVFTGFSIMSGSKKAVILFGIMLLVFALLSSRNFDRALFRVLVAVVLIAIVWTLIMKVPALYKVIGTRMESMLNYFNGGEGDSSTETRAIYWKDAVRLFKENPIVGVGIDGFRYGNIRHGWAENNYLELLADIGAAGTFIYYLLPGMVFFTNLNRASKGYRDGVLILILMSSLLFIDVTMVSYRDDVLQLYLVFAISMHYINKSGQIQQYA